MMEQCSFYLCIAVLLSSAGFPRDLMPILYVARIMVGTFATDVRVVTKMQLESRFASFRSVRYASGIDHKDM